MRTSFLHLKEPPPLVSWNHFLSPSSLCLWEPPPSSLFPQAVRTTCLVYEKCLSPPSICRNHLPWSLGTTFFLHPPSVHGNHLFSPSVWEKSCPQCMETASFSPQEPPSSVCGICCPSSGGITPSSSSSSSPYMLESSVPSSPPSYVRTFCPHPQLPLLTAASSESLHLPHSPPLYSSIEEIMDSSLSASY